MNCNLFKTSHMLCVNIRTSMCVNVWVCMWITTLYFSLSVSAFTVNLALYSFVETGVCLSVSECICECVINLNFCIYS